MSSPNDKKDNTTPTSRHPQSFAGAAAHSRSPSGSNVPGHQAWGSAGPGPTVTPGSTGTSHGRRLSALSPPGPGGNVSQSPSHQSRPSGGAGAGALPTSESTGSMSGRVRSGSHNHRLSAGGLAQSGSTKSPQGMPSSPPVQQSPTLQRAIPEHVVSHSRSGSGHQRTGSGTPPTGTSGQLASSGSQGRIVSEATAAARAAAEAADTRYRAMLRLVFIMTTLDRESIVNPMRGQGNALNWEMICGQMNKDGFTFSFAEL